MKGAYHAEESIRKMQSGIALTDADRSGWLDTLARLLDSAIATPGPGVVLTCSALKRKYRDRLRDAGPSGTVGFVFLDLDYDTALHASRPARAFFSPDLVANQFATLEPPRGGRRACVDATLPLTEIVQRTQSWLGRPHALTPNNINTTSGDSHMQTDSPQPAPSRAFSAWPRPDGAGPGRHGHCRLRQRGAALRFHTSIVSYEEISRLLFVWLVAIGAIVAAFEGSPPGLRHGDIAGTRCPQVLFWVSQLLMLACMGLLLWGSWEQVVAG
jgi:gluconokinase